tara:strand:- start:10736 stop:11422 length:687 start_codon:yes stop_codon:yes gene_type:complete
MNMQKELKKLINSKYLFYFVVIISAFNIFNLFNARKYQTILLFLVLCLCFNYFNKNKTMTLVGALIATYFLKKYVLNLREGMDHEEHEEHEEHVGGMGEGELKEESEDVEQFSGFEGFEESPGPVNGKATPAQVDEKKTRKAMVGENIKGKNVDRLTNDAADYAEKTSSLMEKAEKFEPLMAKAEAMVDAIDTNKLEKMIGTVTNSMKMMGLGSKKNKEGLNDGLKKK